MTPTTDPDLFTGAVRGAVVRYHGSQTGCHGDCFLLAPGVLQTVSHGQVLRQVRRQSYDLLPVPVADIVREGTKDAYYHWAAPADPGRAACGRTRLDDSTAALPDVVVRSKGYDFRCDRPACARRWADWQRQVREGLRSLIG